LTPDIFRPARKIAEKFLFILARLLTLPSGNRQY